MPDYRITIKMRMGGIKTGIRYYPRYDMEDVKAYFEKKVYEIYSPRLVESITVVKIIEGEEKNDLEMGF